MPDPSVAPAEPTVPPDPADPYVAAVARALPVGWALLSWLSDDG